MRLHRNLVLAVIKVLDGVFNHDFYADKTIEKILKHDKRWGSRDRGFIAETSYEIVRWKRLYVEIAEVKNSFDYKNLWKVFSVWAVLKGFILPNWNEFQNTPKRRIKGKFDKLSKIRKYRESVPDWIDDLAVQEIGEKKWEREISALNKMAPVILRTNTLKIRTKELCEVFSREEVIADPIIGYPNALRLRNRMNLFNKNSFQRGFFEIQDASSQLVAPFLKIEPGMKICDICAGAGGKTLHLSALSKNKGKIIAMDIYKHKLDILK
jgi:16S rRNA (cytosine967-C5)-methyltransferase